MNEFFEILKEVPAFFESLGWYNLIILVGLCVGALARIETAKWNAGVLLLIFPISLIIVGFVFVPDDAAAFFKYLTASLLGFVASSVVFSLLESSKKKKAH